MVVGGLSTYRRPSPRSNKKFSQRQCTEASVLPIVVFFIELSLPPETLEQVFYLFGLVPARFAHPHWAMRVGFPVNDYWPFLTHQFLHGGWLHIIGNMWTLWIFGDNVEDRIGSLRFAIFYLTCGFVAAMTDLMTQWESTVPTVGASGAIAGVLGAYLLFGNSVETPKTTLQLFEPDARAVYTLEQAALLTQLSRRLIAVYFKHGLVSPVMDPAWLVF
jgi:membrane associated rhomboid family serine protease